MRIFWSIEERRLLMPSGEGGERSPQSGLTQEQQEAARQKEIEHADAVYERIVKNIEKAKEYYELEKARLGTIEAISELEKQKLKLSESNLNQIGQISEALESILELSEKTEEMDERMLKKANNHLQILEKEIESLKKIQEDTGVQFETLKQLEELQTKIADAKGKSQELDANAIKDLKEQFKLAQRTSQKDIARAQAAEKSQDKIDQIGKKILKNTGLTSNASETMLGQYEGMFEQAKKLGGGDGWGFMYKQMKNTFKSSVNFKNVLYAAVEFSFDLAKQIEKISKDLGVATGYGNVFAHQIQQIGSGLTMLGGDEKTAGEILKTMSDNISSFNPAARKMNVYLAQSIFKLKQYGVSTSTSAKNIDLLQKAMGKTTEQAVEMVSQLAITGRKLGISTDKMVANFGTAYERIALYGAQGKTVFKELSAQVKGTGLEMSRLLEISSKFDTFSGAAEQVAKLNAALGTNLSTLEMLNASDSERIEIIRREVRSSVGNFDNLGKYEKLFIKEAMGVNSVAEAQRLLNMSQAEYLKNTAKQQEAADAQAELARNASELVPALTKLGNLILKFFKLFTPFLNFFAMIGAGIDWVFAKIAELSSGVGGNFERVMVGFKAVFVLAAIAIAGFTASIAPAVAVVLAIAAALGTAYELWHKRGSPQLWILPKYAGEAYDGLANSMGNATTSIGATAKSLDGLHGSFHSMGGSKVDMTAIAKMDTNKIASEIKSTKSALEELSTLKIDGFVAMTTDGNKTSYAMASEGVIKSLSEGRLTVDVNMPEIKMPPVNVAVKVHDQEFKKVIDAQVEKRSV